MSMRRYFPVDITDIRIKNNLIDAPVSQLLGKLSDCQDTDFDTPGVKTDIDGICRFINAIGKPETPQELKNLMMMRINSIVGLNRLEAAQFILSLKGETISKEDILSLHKEQTIQEELTPFIHAISKNDANYICGHLSHIGDPITKQDLFQDRPLTYNKSNGTTLNGKIAAYAIAKSKYGELEEILNSQGEHTQTEDLKDFIKAEDTGISTNGSSMLMGMLYNEPKTLAKIIRNEAGKLSSKDIAFDLEEPKYFHQTAIKNFLKLGNSVVLNRKSFNELSSKYVGLRATYETQTPKDAPLPSEFDKAERIVQIYEAKESNVAMVARRNGRGR